MLYVLSLGVIPAHCVDTYTVSAEGKELGKVKVTSMMGWVAPLLAPLPKWRYGRGSNIEEQIRDLVEGRD